MPSQPDPIRIFVGCAPDGADAESQAVLEYSLRSRSRRPIDITWMIASRDSTSLWHGWAMQRWATPFSGFRWAVPAACGFKGRAIYMDSDTIVQGDIAPLLNWPLFGHHVVAARSPSRFCVCVWDCARALDHLLRLHQLRQVDGHHRQSAYFQQHPQFVESFGSAWNYLDSEDTGPFGTIVHYTDLARQPHLPRARDRLAAAGRTHWYDGPVRDPRPDVAQLFEREFAAAGANGYTPERYVPAERYGAFSKRSMEHYRASR